MALLTWVTLALFALTSRAGTTIWSGSFNAYPTVAAFDNCEFAGAGGNPCDFSLAVSGSWSNEVGEYQWYIHGTENTTNFLALSPEFKVKKRLVEDRIKFLTQSLRIPRIQAKPMGSE